MKPFNPAVKILILLAGTAVTLFLLPFFLRLFLPFLLAFLIAAACQRMIRFLEKRMKISRGISSALLIALLVAGICTLVAVIVYQLVIQTKGLLAILPQGIANLKLQWETLHIRFAEYQAKLSPELSESIDTAIDSAFSSVQNMAQPLADGAINAAKNFAFSLPSIFMFLTMFLLATFFFTKDYTQVINFLKDLIPEHFIKKIKYLKNTVFQAFFKYIKAQLILMCITFAIASAALWSLGISYPLVIGLIIGAVDALPFFGTGIIMFPWAAITLLEGNYFLAAALVVVHLICQLMRQILEPRIVSAQIGVHPILTLVSVYVGLKLFGVAGMLLAPAATMLAVNFYISYRNGKKDYN